MNRTLLAASLALALAACQQAPGGRCDVDADCAAGQHCSNGLCLGDGRQPIGQSCYVDRDCVAWADCVQNQCLLTPGACGTAADCQPWQACSAAHSCETAPGGCAAEADCAAWQDCDTSVWRCETAPGFCADGSGCAAWEDCGTDHLCALAPNACLADGDCDAWEDCGADHFCALAAGMCASSADCENPWQSCDASHVCADEPVDASDVVVTGGFGSLGVTGFAPVDAPAAVRWDTTIQVLAASLSPAGDFVYATEAGLVWEVRRLVPDPLRWDADLARWTAPLDPQANDDVLAASSPDCFSIHQLVLQASSGALLYECPGELLGPTSWRDETGTERVAGGRVVAWTAGGLMLWMASDSVLRPTHVLDAAGTPTPVTGLPAGAIQHARVLGEAFRVAFLPDADPSRPESWTIAAGGAAAYEGTFAEAPAGTSPSPLWQDGALDGSGRLVQHDWVNGLVVRRPLEPAASETVRTNAAPDGSNDPTAVPFLPHLTTDASTMVVTGP
jgi:hypothetical protein